MLIGYNYPVDIELDIYWLISGVVSDFFIYEQTLRLDFFNFCTFQYFL